MATIPRTFDTRLGSCRDLPPKSSIIGQSEVMRGLWRIVEQVASASVPILILGERGTGKEILARLIHSCSPGPDAPFLKLSPLSPGGCSLDEVGFRLESKGSEKSGVAGGNGDAGQHLGTLLVEEVSEVASDCQRELCEVIQGSRSFVSSDGTDVPVALRIIGTSTHGLEQEVAAGKLREDLSSFLSVVTLRLSPLRERKEDIPQLANYFWRIYGERFGCKSAAPSPELIRYLQQHDWPGNIRELENVMKRYVVLGAKGIEDIGRDGLCPQTVAHTSSEQASVSLKVLAREAAQALERKLILKTLQQPRKTASLWPVPGRAGSVRPPGRSGEASRGTGFRWPPPARQGRIP